MRKQRDPGDKAVDNHGRPFKHLPRSFRKNKTMIDNCVSVEAASHGGVPTRHDAVKGPR